MNNTHLSRLSARLAAGAFTLLLPATLLGQAYSTAVLTDGPLAYYRFNDPARSTNVVNYGSLGAAGNGGSINSHPVGGALAGSTDSAAYYNGTGARTLVPFQADNNPPEGQSFTVEAWFMVTQEVSDSPGPCPLFNRISSGDRSGWVFFQRSPETGWNFRMYSGTGSTVGVDVTGQASSPNAGKAGTWSHMVVTWDGPNSTATMYINGENVGSATGTYLANTAANPPSLSVGSYDTGSNPFVGAVDEVAIYKKALTEAQITAHYQNGTNANRSLAYDSLVVADGAVEYLRLNETSPDKDVAVNFGSAGIAGDGEHGPGVRHPARGVLSGSSDTGAGYHSKNGGGGGVTTLVPWSAALNPDASTSFTIEAWLKVLTEVTDSPGPAPLMNRYSYSGENRQGWVFFQRSPTTGWNFRTYTGEGSSVGIDITGQSSAPDAGTLGTWTHLVVAYDGPSTTATMYVNGEQVASGSGGYVANTDDHAGFVAAGLALGSYNNTGPGQNPFDGVVDEVALYGDALTADQVVAHYQAGTNDLASAGYAALILADQPVEYLRLGEPAFNPVKNFGTLGTKADAALISATNDQSGPLPADFAGFETNNAAAGFDGLLGFASIGNPDGLAVSTFCTLEAWIQPAAAQGATANIIVHGGVPASTAAVLRITGGTSYEVGSDNHGGLDGVSVAIPAEDLTGTAWVHLAGTYDGTAWNLYRNGVLIGSNTNSEGAVTAPELEWAIGSRPYGDADAFKGLIDEAAIYNKALSAAQIAAHYSSGVGALKSLSLARSGADVTITWSGGTLQSADDVAGTYTDVTGAPQSPLTVTPAGARKFYRLKP
ncbi:MAG TPA: LamG domain-containing protein [Candidatus Limnocylindria bacterium]|jgi:hypothetical protein|nr:LamG domain-containing protein [Candidatus Limnocylindria bacterium]